MASKPYRVWRMGLAQNVAREVQRIIKARGPGDCRWDHSVNHGSFPMMDFRGNHLSNTTCLTHELSKSDE